MRTAEKVLEHTVDCEKFYVFTFSRLCGWNDVTQEQLNSPATAPANSIKAAHQGPLSWIDGKGYEGSGRGEPPSCRLGLWCGLSPSNFGGGKGNASGDENMFPQANNARANIQERDIPR